MGCIRETTSDSTRTTQLIEVFSTSSLASFSLLYTITSRKIWRINQRFPFGKKEIKTARRKHPQALHQQSQLFSYKVQANPSSKKNLKMSSIAALLQAAEYVERREREVEHGYASSLPGPFVLDESYNQTRNHLSIGVNSNSSFKRLKTPNNKKPQGNRSTHNELEKNRRAHLRNCLEKLKDIVPVGGDSSRHTTLGLLNKAKHFIKSLEEKERKVNLHKDNLNREQRYLRRRLELLSNQVDTIYKGRSVSECSTSTVSSTHSSHSESDYEDFSDDVKTGNGSFRHQLSVADLLTVGEVDLCKPSANDDNQRIEVEVV